MQVWARRPGSEGGMEGAVPQPNTYVIQPGVYVSTYILTQLNTQK
jgi:hypothetical protein